MPHHVVSRLAEALDRKAGKALSRSRVLILGLAYKKNVPDIRESPSLRLMELILERGAEVAYFDPFLPEIPKTREYSHLKGRRSIAWNQESLATFDAVLIATDHDTVDYQQLADWCPLIIDTRNALARRNIADQAAGHTIVKA